MHWSVVSESSSIFHIQVTKKGILRWCQMAESSFYMPQSFCFFFSLPWIIKEYQVIMWLLKYFCLSSQHSVVWWDRMVELMGTSSWWDLLKFYRDAISVHMKVATKTLSNAVKWCFWDSIYNTGSNGGFPFSTHYSHHQLSIPSDDNLSWFEIV